MSIQPGRIRRHVVWHVDTAHEEKRVSFTFRVKGTCFYPEKVGSRFSRNAANNLPNCTTSHTHWDPNLVHCLFLARQPPVGLTRFLDHTQRRTTVSRTPLDEWSARRRDLYLTTHNTHNRQTSIPLVGFEPTIPAGERPKTNALDRATIGTGKVSSLWDLINRLYNPILSRMNQIHIFILSCHLRLGLQTDLFHKLSPTLPSHYIQMPVTYITHPIWCAVTPTGILITRLSMWNFLLLLAVWFPTSHFIWKEPPWQEVQLYWC